MKKALPIRLGILEAGANRPEFVGQYGTFADWFKALFERSETAMTFEAYQCYLGQLPPSAEACDAYLVTGSAASVNDPDDWIGDLAGFLGSAASQRPIIGVCFGHQLLHKAFGGTVARNPGGWGVGIHDYQMPRPVSLMPGTRSLSFIASHSEQVTVPAHGTVNLATSDFCPYALTTIGDNILTVQAHPEAAPDMAARLYEFRRETLGGAVTDKAIATLDRPTDETLFVHAVTEFMEARRPA